MADAPTLSAVLDRCRAYCRARGLTPGQLATKAGLSRGTLARFYEADWLPTTSTLQAIERLIPGGWRAGDPLPAEADVGANDLVRAAPGAIAAE